MNIIFINLLNIFCVENGEANYSTPNDLVQSTVHAMIRLNLAGKRESTYDIKISKTVNINLYNVKMANNEMEMYTQDGDQPDALLGVTGTNYIKNISYDNCRLNRIDTHQGIRNLTVKNSAIGYWGLTQIGFGRLIIENVTVKHANTFISLRRDYGYTWNGRVIVNGDNHIYPENADPCYLIGTSDGIQNLDFGYDLYLPSVTFNEGSSITIHNSETSNFYIFDKSRNYYQEFQTGGGYQFHNDNGISTKNGTVKNSSDTIINVSSYLPNNSEFFRVNFLDIVFPNDTSIADKSKFEGIISTPSECFRIDSLGYISLSAI